MPPAALVRMTALMPMRAKTRMGKGDFFGGVAFVEMDAALHSCDAGRLRHYR